MRMVCLLVVIVVYLPYVEFEWLCSVHPRRSALLSGLCRPQHLCPTWFIWRWVSNTVFVDLLLHSAESGLHTPPSWLRASPLPLTLILYHKIREKSIGNVAQTFNQIIVQNDEAPIKRGAPTQRATAKRQKPPLLRRLYSDGWALTTSHYRLCPCALRRY